MKPSIFQGANLTKLPATHCGSVYLASSTKVYGICVLDRFQRLLDSWGKSCTGSEYIIGAVEKGGVGTHLQVVSCANEDFIHQTMKFSRATNIRKYRESRLVKVKSDSAVSGFQDIEKYVEGVKITSKSMVINLEPIIDVSSSMFYVTKQVDYGVNLLYYFK